MRARPPSAPPPRSATVRDALRAALREAPATAHELSRRVGVGERDVAGHLEPLARSAAARGGAAPDGPGGVRRLWIRLPRAGAAHAPLRLPPLPLDALDPPVFSLQRA